MKELIKIEIDSEEVDPLKDYDFAGLSGFGRGLFKKGIISGANTTYKKFNKLHSRSLVLSKVKGWEGAIAIVSDDFEGLYLSPQYPTFKPIGDEVDIQFIAYYFKQAKTWAEIFNLSKGIGARRNSVSEKQFLEIEIDVPPINIQRTIIEKLDFIQNKIVEIKKLIVQQKKDIEDLLYSKFSDLVKGVSYRKMAKTAPIIRRPVVIELDGEYPELGVRGFGRGIFHKPTLIGADLDWQKLYTIHQGDLVISNIKAWEGAIAVAGKEDHSRVGSHRYITCVPHENVLHPEFLCSYLLYPEGMEQIQAASPGSADRNRTLAMKRLEQITVPIPEYAEQVKFVNLKRQLRQIHKHHKKTLQELDELMPSLLDKAFKGEL